jgi:hypothetical protein
MTRQVLNQNTTFYVDYVNGVDSNDGTTPQTAFKRLQRAVDFLISEIDFASYTVTIKMADNTTDLEGIHYAPHDLLGAQGGAAVRILGGVNSVINTSTKSAIECYFAAIIQLENVRLQSIYYAISAWFGSFVYLNNVTFGDCGVGHIFAATQGQLSQIGPIYIDGNTQYHLVCSTGIYTSNGNSLNITKNLSFNNFIYAVNLSSVDYSNSSVVLNGHSVTGVRYRGYSNSIISTGNNNINLFPGNSPGSVSSGAIYQ